ncbi:MAG: MerR family transcriptional regulator [Elusimicrobia bacterium]|nr:MerR family transcriptional regulator [Elusimicrobiota bacterium]
MTSGAGAPPPLPPGKDYFTIAEACRLLQVPAHTMRYWEGLFSALRPTRLPGGHRRYRRADLELAFRIKGLLRDERLTVAGARKALAAMRRPARAGAGADGAANPASLKLLKRVREDLQRLLDDLSR